LKADWKLIFEPDPFCKLHTIANRMTKSPARVLPLLILFVFLSCGDEPKDTDWPEYYGDGSRSHYAALDQINRENIKSLEVAWVYQSGGADTTGNGTQMQCNPIIVDGVMYGVSADIQAFAIDAESGAQIWKTDLEDVGGTSSRGVTYWTDGKVGRIFFGAGRWIHALDVKNGMLDPGFGDKGRLDLVPGIVRPGADEYVSPNTPNTIYEDLLITSSRVSETETALLGDIRAFDVRTGNLVWTFQTIPGVDDPAYDTWFPAHPRERLGGANAWMGMAVDRERAIVYVPTGSAAFDFYGANRIGDNLYANCLLALDAISGKKIWHYQIVRHDIWDRDPPSPPNLHTIVKDGQKVDVVSLVTKQGYVFAFDRETGEPIFPIEDVAFNQDVMDQDKASPTQPIPTLPLPFSKHGLTENDLNDFVANRDSVVRMLKTARTGDLYMPITDVMTLIYPGTGGGAQWGGAATDPQGILYVPSKDIPVYTSLVPKDISAGQENTTGEKLYDVHCSACHGADRAGNHDGSYPSLLEVQNKLSGDQVEVLLNSGRGMMPSFSHLSDQERNAIHNFILGKGDSEEVVSTQKLEVPYHNAGYNRWYDENNYPINAPPWVKPMLPVGIGHLVAG